MVRGKWVALSNNFYQTSKLSEIEKDKEEADDNFLLSGWNLWQITGYNITWKLDDITWALIGFSLKSILKVVVKVINFNTLNRQARSCQGASCWFGYLHWQKM